MIKFVNVEHDCTVPDVDLNIGETARYKWRCPECRQRWFVVAGWHSSTSKRYGRTSRKWSKARQAELLAQATDS